MSVPYPVAWDGEQALDAAGSSRGDQRDARRIELDLPGHFEATRDGARGLGLYRLNGEALKPIHDWVRTYERNWSKRFDALDVVLEELKEEEDR